MMDSEAPKPLAVTVQSACRLTGLGKSSIYELIKDGKLSTTNIGRRRLIRFSSLEELIAA
jgi:excisionase family DNA binding protein